MMRIAKFPLCAYFATAFANQQRRYQVAKIFWCVICLVNQFSSSTTFSSLISLVHEKKEKNVTHFRCTVLLDQSIFRESSRCIDFQNSFKILTTSLLLETIVFKLFSTIIQSKRSTSSYEHVSKATQHISNTSLLILLQKISIWVIVFRLNMFLKYLKSNHTFMYT